MKKDFGLRRKINRKEKKERLFCSLIPLELFCCELPFLADEGTYLVVHNPYIYDMIAYQDYF